MGDESGVCWSRDIFGEGAPLFEVKEMSLSVRRFTDTIDAWKDGHKGGCLMRVTARGRTDW